MPLKLITPPAGEPVTLDEVKTFGLRLSRTDHDLYLPTAIAAARSDAEAYCRISIMPQTWRLTASSFPSGNVFYLPRPPVTSITSVEYWSGGSYLTLASTNYVLAANSTGVPAELHLADGASWPSHDAHPEAVRVTYVAGWPDSGSVPGELKTWILHRIAQQYDDRPPGAFIDSYIWRHRVLAEAA